MTTSQNTLKDGPRVSLKEGMIGTTDERGFVYIAPNATTALLLGFDANECWRHFQEGTGLIIQLDADSVPTGILYNATDVAHCLEILELIRLRKFFSSERIHRKLVRSVGRTQCRRWGLTTVDAHLQGS